MAEDLIIEEAMGDREPAPVTLVDADGDTVDGTDEMFYPAPGLAETAIFWVPRYLSREPGETRGRLIANTAIILQEPGMVEGQIMGLTITLDDYLVYVPLIAPYPIPAQLGVEPAAGVLTPRGKFSTQPIDIELPPYEPPVQAAEIIDLMAAIEAEQAQDDGHLAA